MEVKPELIRFNEFEHGCSMCKDFRIRVMRPIVKTEEDWQSRREQQFCDHLEKSHSHEK